ncbi:FkbM family methyltransferase [bacterium]|nr:MAG: FkbM family methyltransferase [bacterium]
MLNKPTHKQIIALRKQIIILIFNKYLAREPKEEELNYYLISSISIEEILAFVLNSEEAVNIRSKKEIDSKNETLKITIQNQQDEERVLFKKIFKLLWENQYGRIDRLSPVKIQYNDRILSLRLDDMYILGEMEAGAYEIFDIERLVHKTISLVDVGLNVGLSVVRFQDQLQKLGLEINSLTGVEPLTSNILLAKRNIKILGIQKANLLQKCLSETEGKSELYFPNEINTNWGGVQSRASAKGSLIEECSNIKFLDLLNEHTFEDVNILKIDIEGAEKDLFATDQNVQLLEKFDYLYIENHDWLNNEEYFSEIDRKILKRGFVQSVNTANVVYSLTTNRDKCYIKY